MPAIRTPVFGTPVGSREGAWIWQSGPAPAAGDVLSGPEVARLARMKVPAKRALKRDSLIVRRLLLAELLDAAPEAIGIAHDESGRPVLPESPELAVSFSDSRGWNALALSCAGAVGIDIEVVRDIKWAPMLHMISAPQEAALLHETIVAAGNPVSFFRAWTAKEAVLKAAGAGLRGGAPRVHLQAGYLSGRDTAAVILLDDVTYRLEGLHTGETVVARAIRL